MTLCSVEPAEGQTSGGACAATAAAVFFRRPRLEWPQRGRNERGNGPLGGEAVGELLSLPPELVVRWSKEDRIKRTSRGMYEET